MALIPPLHAAADPLAAFLDAPEARKVHTTPVPRVGGIAMAAGTAAGVGTLRRVRTTHACVPGGRAGVAVVWRLGRSRHLECRSKLLGQVIAVLVIMVWGDVTIATLSPTGRTTLPAWISWPLTFVFLIGVTNAINLADGLDGLAGGTTCLSLSALALLAFTSGTPFVGAVAIVIVGAILGFLPLQHPSGAGVHGRWR